MINQPTILLNTILTYLGPIIEAAGHHIDPTTGMIVDNVTGQRIAYMNPRYQEGESDDSVPSVIVPVVPLNYEHFGVIREDPGLETFNPFSNPKHISAILYKLKKVLIPFVLSPVTLNKAHSEEEIDTLDEYLQLYNRTDKQKYFEVGIVSTETPEMPKEIIKAAGESHCQATWNLCVLIYNNYVNTDQKKPKKEFSNLDLSWRKINRRMEEWDKEKKLIISEIKQENKNIVDDSNEMMNFSANEGYNPDVNIPLFSQPTEYVSEDEMDSFLTSLFDPEDLKPYIPPVTTDEIAPHVEDQVIEVRGSIPEVSDSELDVAQDNMNKMLLNEIQHEVPSQVMMGESIETTSVNQSEEINVPDGVLKSNQNTNMFGENYQNFNQAGKIDDLPRSEPEVQHPTKLVLGGGTKGPQMTKNPQVFVPQQTSPYGAPMGMNMNPMMGGGYGMNPMIGIGMQNQFNPFGNMKSNIEEMDLTGGSKFLNPYGAF